MIKKTYGSTNEMTRYIHNLTLWYVRGIRAYHLKNKYWREEDDFNANEEEKVEREVKLHQEGPEDASGESIKHDGLDWTTWAFHGLKGPRVFDHCDLAGCFGSLLSFLVESK